MITFYMSHNSFISLILCPQCHDVLILRPIYLILHTVTGSFIRHACGSFGESFSEEAYLNKVDHLFDCIVMGQQYGFNQGQVTFTNR